MEKDLHRIFFISILIKAMDGVFEVLGGLALLLPWLLINTPAFAAVYLLSHGAIKIFLAVTLLMKKLWAYPLTIIVLGLFIVYQIYRFSYTHSIFLIILTLFDALIIILTWNEYQRMKKSPTMKR